MAALTWNMDFNDLALDGGDDARWADVTPDPEVSLPCLFWTALAERRKVLSYSRRRGYTDYPFDSDSLEGQGALDWWYGLQREVKGLADLVFLRPGPLQGKPFLDGLIRHLIGPIVEDYQSYGSSNFDRSRRWTGAELDVYPGPDGWHRRFPREIYALSCEGDDGEKARFYTKIRGSLVTSVETDDPSFGSSTTRKPVESDFVYSEQFHRFVPGPDYPFADTPSGERRYSGRNFQRTDGEWVLSETIDYDIVDEMAPMSQDLRDSNAAGDAIGTPYGTVRGDIFGGHWLNALRDAINELVWLSFTTVTSYRSSSSVGGNNVIWGHRAFPRAAGRGFSGYFGRQGFEGKTSLRDFHAGSLLFRTRFARQDVTGASGPTDANKVVYLDESNDFTLSDTGVRVGTIEAWIEGTDCWLVLDSAGLPTYEGLDWTLDFLPNPDGLTRTVEVWSVDPSEDIWTLLHSFGETEDEDAFGETGLDVAYLTSATGQLGGGGNTSDNQFVLTSPNIAVVQKFDGPDGFKYTADNTD